MINKNNNIMWEIIGNACIGSKLNKTKQNNAIAFPSSEQKLSAHSFSWTLTFANYRFCVKCSLLDAIITEE